MIETDTDELREYLKALVKEYRKRWANSPYGGPAEVLPRQVDEIVTAFLDAFEEAKKG